MKYDNAEVRLRAAKNIPRIQTPGITVAEVQEGNEFTTWFWVGRELINAGLADYAEDPVSQNEWTQVHFKERINPAGPPSPLPNDFYARAYQSFVQARDDDEKRTQINRMRARYREIIESRIGRVMRLASSEAVSSTSALEKTEADLYKDVNRITSDWRDTMRSLGEE